MISRLVTAALGVILFMLACALVVLGSLQTGDPSVVLTTQPRTTTATVESVNLAERWINVRDEQGEQRTMRVPPEIAGLDNIRPSSAVRVTFFDHITMRIKARGERDSPPRPVGTTGTMETVTATVQVVDRNTPSISFRGAHGWTFRTRLQDRRALAAVRVGDRVDLTWKDVTLVAIAPSHK